MTRYICVTGGVVSSLGKGIAAASLGAILEARGLKVSMKFVAAGLLILLVLLQYRLWFGDGSVREVAQLQTQISAQEEQNAKLRERNRTLAAEVQDLKKGTTAIEERARTDLGMVGKSETFYQVVSPEDAPSADQR